MTAGGSVLAAVQMRSGDDVAQNLAAARRLLGAARDAGATLAVLPENFALMSAHENGKLAIAESPGEGPIQRAVAGWARELGLWIVAGTVPLRLAAEPARVAAACLVFDTTGECRARYDKMHLFDVEVPDGGGAPAERSDRYRESATIAPGAAPAAVVTAGVARLGLSVCYDLRFPELFRKLVAQGAEVLAVPAAFTAKTGAAHWEVLLRARAVENLCYVVAAAQVGEHPGGRRTYGHSLIVDPWGSIIAQVREGEGVAIAPMSQTNQANLRRRFPVLDHRRL